MSPDDDAALTRFALLDGFFRRRDEAGKFYCATCLVGQLRARGSRAFSLAAVQGAVKDAFKRPGELQLTLAGTCDACQKPRPCVGAARPE
jgi:hypothetical protein